MSEERNRVVTIFSILWRVAVLSLPWQTRWFADAQLGGWPWEQGRWSIYGSWVFMLTAIVLSLLVTPVKTVFELRNRKWLPVFVGVVSLFVISLIAVALNADPQLRIAAVAQWWMQIALLAAFVWSLWRTGVTRKSLATMFVVSLVPEVALGLWQFAAQYVVPMKWLGIALQDPRNLGVSVVEYDIYRYLRVYGGFPHPNIFGGWLALGMLVSAWLAFVTERKAQALLWILTTALCSVTLFLTFARGAWIAAVLGIVLFGVNVFRSKSETEESGKQFFVLALIATFLFTGIIAFTQRHLILSRVNPTQRLEAKSLDERKQSLVDGIVVHKEHPFFGTGPNAELIDLVHVKLAPDKTKLLAPAQPPHNVFELFVVDFGILGVLAVGFLLAVGRKTVKRFLMNGYWIVLPLGVVGMVDHFLLSTWAGVVLLFLATGFILAPASPSDTS